MPTVRADEPAFGSDYSRGMTIREYIATQTLAALTGKYGADQAANLAVIYADALLARLNQPEGTVKTGPALSIRLDPHREEDIEDDRVLDLDELDRAGEPD